MAHISRSVNRKTFAEFFAGIGLVHLGLRPCGWQCAYANDLEPKKREMYEGHFGPSPYFHVEDIWNADSVMRKMKDRPFMATASFPCVDLSLAGHWRGFDGEHSSTYFGFLEILRRTGEDKPKLIMLENVTGFLTSRGGDDFRRAILELAELGYWIDAIVLDARWFVPQSRPRTFIFGFHDTLGSPLVLRKRPGLDFGDPWRQAISRSTVVRPNILQMLMEDIVLPTGWATVDFNPPAQAAYELGGVLDTDDGQEWWSADQILKHYIMMETPSRKRVDDFVRSKATVVGTAFRRTRNGKMRTEVRFDIAGCLRTPKGGSAKQIVVAIINGALRMRWMSAREYARLQGAPEYRISVPPLQAMYGFGDAVCVPAVEWIDRAILTPVFQSTVIGAVESRGMIAV